MHPDARNTDRAARTVIRSLWEPTNFFWAHLRCFSPVLVSLDLFKIVEQVRIFQVSQLGELVRETWEIWCPQITSKEPIFQLFESLLTQSAAGYDLSFLVVSDHLETMLRHAPALPTAFEASLKSEVFPLKPLWKSRASTLRAACRSVPFFFLFRHQPLYRSRAS